MWSSQPSCVFSTRDARAHGHRHIELLRLLFYFWHNIMAGIKFPSTWALRVSICSADTLSAPLTNCRDSHSTQNRNGASPGGLWSPRSKPSQTLQTHTAAQTQPLSKIVKHAPKVLLDQGRNKEYRDEYLEKHQKPKDYIPKPMGDSWFYSRTIKCLYYEKEKGRKRRVNRALAWGLGGVGVLKLPPRKTRGKTCKDEGINK